MSNLFNSEGILVGKADDQAIFDLSGKKLYGLKGVNIYRLSGELVGHLDDVKGAKKRLVRSSDRLFPKASS
jgi:hypothetical protein